MGYADYLNLYEAFADSPYSFSDALGLQYREDMRQWRCYYRTYVDPHDPRNPVLDPPMFFGAGFFSGLLSTGLTADSGYYGIGFHMTSEQMTTLGVYDYYSAGFDTGRLGQFAAFLYYMAGCPTRNQCAEAFNRLNGMCSNAPRLVVGGGRAQDFPPLRRGDISLNIRESASPHVVGDIAQAPFRPGMFGKVFVENVEYSSFTGRNERAISEMYCVLQPGGRLILQTGRCAPVDEILRHLEREGFCITETSLRPILRIIARK